MQVQELITDNKEMILFEDYILKYEKFMEEINEIYPL